MNATKKLGQKQKTALYSLRNYGPYPGGWKMGTASKTERVLESLVKLGLATKTTQKPWHGNYDYVRYTAVEVNCACGQKLNDEPTGPCRFCRLASETAARRAENMRTMCLDDLAAFATRYAENARSHQTVSEIMDLYASTVTPSLTTGNIVWRRECARVLGLCVACEAPNPKSDDWSNDLCKACYSDPIEADE